MSEDLDPKLKKTLDWAKKTSSVKTPAGLENRIIARLKEKERRTARPWAWGLSGGLVTATVAVLIFFSMPKEVPQEKFSEVAEFDYMSPGAPPLKSAPAAKKESKLKTAAPMQNRIIARDADNFGAATGKSKALRRADGGFSSELAGLAKDNKNEPTRVIRTEQDGFPKIDFSKEMLLVLFDGKIVSQKIEDGKLVVRYRRAANPTPERPTDVLAVPRFGGPVEFRLVD